MSASPLERLTDALQAGVSLKWLLEQAGLDAALYGDLKASMVLEELAKSWRFTARPEQIAPDGEWDVLAWVTGRGFGKTRSACSWFHERVRALAESSARRRYGAGAGALVHRTTSDVREVLVEGEAGILATAPTGWLPKYEPSKRRVTWPNGFKATTFSAEEPDQLRGPEHSTAIGEEFATWKSVVGVDGLTAFDNLLFSMRSKRTRPQLVLTTTPKRTRAMRDLEAKHAADPQRNIIVRGSMYDNKRNLAPSFVEMIEQRYAGTSLGDQEIYGKIAKDAEGSVFKSHNFDKGRTPSTDLPQLSNIVVGVDPSVGDGSHDECGIVVAGMSAAPLPTLIQTEGGVMVPRQMRHGYILEDLSIAAPPDVWAQRVVHAASQWGTLHIAVEGNNGGQVLKSILRPLNPNLRIKIVYAKQGKEVRAEPVAGLFAQGVWHMVDELPELEDQSTSYVPGTGMDSPDRMDAMVWAVHYLEPQIGKETKVAKFGQLDRVLT